MLVFTKGVDPLIIAKEATTIMLLGGEPLGERFIWWNFVSSRKERIEQAKEDWKQGRIILPPNDNHEFIPCPTIIQNRQAAAAWNPFPDLICLPVGNFTAQTPPFYIIKMLIGLAAILCYLSKIDRYEKRY